MSGIFNRRQQQPRLMMGEKQRMKAMTDSVYSDSNTIYADRSIKRRAQKHGKLQAKYHNHTELSGVIAEMDKLLNITYSA